jgi:hypothetical protein
MRQTVGKILASILVVALAVTVLMPISTANAAQITGRKLTLVAGASDGGSKAGGVVNHLFNFTLPSNTSVGSIQFQYCTTASGTCTMPPGLVTTSATLNSQAGLTGFTMVNTTNGSPYITRSAAVGTGAVSYQLNTITNPSANNTTFFVRITTFSSTTATTGSTDTGTVAASTAEPIVLTGVMPESLIFCTGATVNTNCTTTTSGAISFNQLFSPSDTAVATSQMSASTNAGTGYTITVNGPNLASGANSIPGITPAATAASTRGTSKWGLNLRANTTSTSAIATGADLTPASDAVNLKGQALSGYNTVDTFKFVSGDAVANSAYDGSANTTLGPTNSQVYTATYIANVAGNQLAGTYTTTLTYICTPTF